MFSWTPDARFDVIFFSAWLSHVPANWFEQFWRWLRGLLAEDGTGVAGSSTSTLTNAAGAGLDDLTGEGEAVHDCGAEPGQGRGRAGGG